MATELYPKSLSMARKEIYESFYSVIRYPYARVASAPLYALPDSSDMRETTKEAHAQRTTVTYRAPLVISSL